MSVAGVSEHLCTHVPVTSVPGGGRGGEPGGGRRAGRSGVSL